MDLLYAPTFVTAERTLQYIYELHPRFDNIVAFEIEISLFLLAGNKEFFSSFFNKI